MLQRVFRLVCLMALVASSTTLSAASQRAIFIVHGGYGSCGGWSGYEPTTMPIMDTFLETFEKAQSHFHDFEMEYVTACLTSDAPPHAYSYFRHSGDLEELLYIESGSLFEVLIELKADKETPVFLMGHSYGAWTLMNLVAEHGKDFNIQGLYTLDPIGPNDCTPFGVIWHDEGCFRAPTDLDNKRINELTKNWLNFYQDTDRWVQSSQIAEADQNSLISYENSGGHREIDADKRVWADITQSVMAYTALFNF